MQEKLSFSSDGLKLSAVLHVPEGRNPGQKLPAFIVLHGFVGSKDESHAEIQAKMLESMGYAALRFDFRCCGVDALGARSPTALVTERQTSGAAPGVHGYHRTKPWQPKSGQTPRSH